MKEIRKIIKQYDDTDWSTEKAALAIVVQVEESAYRRIGARMFVRSSGHWTGGISGGCLEGDALRQAQKAIYNDIPSIVVYDTMDDDAHQIGVGLGCNGRIEVLFIPLDPKDYNNPVERLKTIQNQRVPAIFYQSLDKNIESNIYPFGDSNLSDAYADLINVDIDLLDKLTKEVVRRKKSKVYALTNANGQKLKVLIEYIRPELKLILIGDNYDANAFIGIAHEMGWEIHIVGTERKLHHLMLNNVKSINTYDKVDQVEIDEYTAIVLMTHDFNWDKKMLKTIGVGEACYIGMLGPRKRSKKMQAELKKEGVSIDLLSGRNFYSPVGLDIGAESPEEIALAISAEIISVFRNRKGSSLRDRTGTIHSRE